MPRIIPPELVESVVRVVLGSIDIGDGGTDEQRRLIRALVVGDWGRTDLDLDALEPASAEEAASAYPMTRATSRAPTPSTRRRSGWPTPTCVASPWSRGWRCGMPRSSSRRV
jgi:hypothetical protein